jgi:hypothetical protein
MPLQLQDNSVDGWAAVIKDLTSKRQSLLQALEQLRAQKRDLALEASMGSDSAEKQSAKLSAEIATMSLQVDEYQRPYNRLLPGNPRPNPKPQP